MGQSGVELSLPEGGNGRLRLSDLPRLPEHEFDNIRFLVPSWEYMGTLTFRLAAQIRESGRSFDTVVALAKGGWTWTRTLVDYLGMESIATMRTRLYTDIGQTLPEPEILEPVSIPVKGKRLLLFDEVVDSGKSIDAARDYLLGQEHAVSVHTAALCYKPVSVVKPDYYALETSAWVIFPHEIHETIEMLRHKWEDHGVAQPDIMHRFGVLGLPAEQVVYFMQDALQA